LKKLMALTCYAISKMSTLPLQYLNGDELGGDNALWCSLTCPVWRGLLKEKLWTVYGDWISKQLNADYNKYHEGFQIFPCAVDIFRAFKECPHNRVKVVIIGQDCYINPGEAHGLAFSVGVPGVKMPPSLRNIFKEIQREYGGEMRRDMNLIDWARQGVLLLNTALTVRQSCSGSHIHIWKDFTTDLIKHLGGSLLEGCVFMLWGNHAQEYEKYINADKNLVLKHSHPSPLARRPFVGNGHFRKCNEYLEIQGKEEIVWANPDNTSSTTTHDKC
jgi:uracil-DNA glycosylase